MTIQAALEDFIMEQKFRGNTLKTQIYYQQSVMRFINYAGGYREVGSVGIPLLREYYVQLTQEGLSSNSTQTYLRALRTFLSYCFEQGYVENDLSSKFKLPKAKRMELDVLSDAEVQRLLNGFDLRRELHLRNYCICALMIDSGLRMNEVVTLRCSKLKLAEGYAIVDGKGNKQRAVPLGRNTQRALGEYLNRRPASSSAFVFLMPNRKPITINSVKQMFQALKGSRGIPRLHAHLLRHTFATRFLENGGDMYTLQQILGHTSLEMVKRYVHTNHQRMIPRFSKFSPLDNLNGE